MSDPAPETTPAPDNTELSNAITEIAAPADTNLDVNSPDFLSTILDDIGKVDEPEPKAEPAKAEPEAKVEPEVKADGDDFPEDPPGKGSEAAKKGWKELKTEAARLRTENQTYQTQLREAQDKLTKLTELEEKAKFVDDAEKELAITRVEATREFAKIVTEPLEAIGAAAEDLAKRNELDPELLYDAILQTDTTKRNKALDALLAGVSEHDKFSVYEMIRDSHTILAKGQELRNKAVEARKELDARQKDEQEVQTRESRKKFESEVRRTHDSLKDRIPFDALTEGETPEVVFNEILNKALNSDYASAGPDVQAYSVVAGFLVPRLVKQLHAKGAALKSAEERIAEITRTAPSDNRPKTTIPASKVTDDFLAGIGAELSW